MMHYKIKSKIWIESNGKILLGEGRVQLLKAIKETGSLSKASKKLNMSYKKAWGLIDAVNSIAEKEVVIKNIGGKSEKEENQAGLPVVGHCGFYTHLPKHSPSQGESR